MSQKDYTKEMDWSTQDKPSILTWQIKTIAHRWQQLGYFFILMMAAFVITTIVILCINQYKDWMTPLLPLIGLFVFGYFFVLEIRRKTWLIYKFFDTGAELYYWKAYPEWLFVLIPILMGITCIVAIVLGAITGQWLIALTGPVGIAFVMGAVAMSKGYKDAMVNFSHLTISWIYIDEAEYDIKRNVIRLFCDSKMTEEDRQAYRANGFTEERINRIITSWDFYIFPTPALTEQVISLVESSLKTGVSLERKKIKLPETL